MVQTDPVPDSERKSLAESASTWMQVVFGGLSVAIAIVALVIAYFAWVEPHSPDDDTGRTQRAPAATTTSTTGTTATSTISTPQPTVDRRRVALTDLIPSVGGTNVRRAGSDLMMPCASGETSDRHRTVEYDLADRYVAMVAKLTVTKAADPDAQLQLKVFTDELTAANVILTKGKSADVEVALDGKKSLKIQLTCQSPNSEMTIGAPSLTHV